MKDKKHFRSILVDVRQHLERRAFDEARRILADLVNDPDIAALGPMTVVGLPRPLHATFLKLAKVEGDVLRKIAYQYTLVPPTALLAEHGRFTSVERAAMAAANRMPVPRMIHQIWIGSKPVPITTRAWQAHAQRHGYGYKLWREDDLDTIGVGKNPVFAAMHERGDMPGAVDVARYIVMQQMGGIYLDCDWYPARDDISFHDRLSLIGLNVIAEDVPRDTGFGSVLLSNALIAAPADHPAITRMLKALPAALLAMPDAPAWWSTGPLLFTVVCRGGAVAIADSALVAGSAAREASEAEVHSLCAQVLADDGGLLLAWKPW